MKDARSPSHPALLAHVVELIAKVPMEYRDTKGDLYEYMLSKIATTGQFRTPRNQLMVELMRPQPKDVVYDSAAVANGQSKPDLPNPSNARHQSKCTAQVASAFGS